MIRRFLRIFKGIDDFRIQAMTDYPLEELLLIAFLAVLGNNAFVYFIKTTEDKNGNRKEEIRYYIASIDDVLENCGKIRI